MNLDTDKIKNNPLWYVEFKDFILSHFVLENEKEKDNEWYTEREEFVKFIAKALSNGEVSLAEEGIDFDLERKDIDTIVIHHTSRPPDTSLDILNALSLLRLYVPIFLNTSSKNYLKPLWSNHFFDGKMIFVPYHYIVYPDGSFIQILSDEMIGWHCGNWNFNTRSIAIAFADELDDKEPSNAALSAGKSIIEKYNPLYIFGHCEINFKTSCPGALFSGKDGWKNKLV